MGKLVLFLKDQSPVEVPLAKERVTIGRRADNDVCLPYPAVSGEHAAVVTILTDSFLEDLGSTNGTLVNGRPIAKHFLRDRDQIDIGRQLLVYLADVEAHAEPPPVIEKREDRRDLARRVEPARSAGRIEPTLSAVDEDLGAALGIPPADPSRSEPVLREPPQAAAMPSATNRIPTEAVAEDATFDDDLARLQVKHAEARASEAGEPPSAQRNVGAPVHGRLRIASGPSSGRVVDIAREDFVIGRVGLQVAAIESHDGVVRLVPREGAEAPTVNGAPVPSEGLALTPGDTLEIAGTRLEFVSAE
jgi:pSer/pThr/pTyr-binding forkhead associated (FHA) protein